MNGRCLWNVIFEGDMEAAWTEESGPVHLGSCLEQCSSCNGHLSLREEYPARRLCCMCGIREKTTERFKDRWRDPFESALIIGRQFRLLNRDKPRRRRFLIFQNQKKYTENLLQKLEDVWLSLLLV